MEEVRNHNSECDIVELYTEVFSHVINTHSRQHHLGRALSNLQLDVCKFSLISNNHFVYVHMS